MPVKSKAQAKIRASMSAPALRDYATGSTRGLPEHKTAAAKKQRAALRATTESSAYNNRSRNNLKRGMK